MHTKRLIALFVVFTLVFMAMAARLVMLQVVQAPAYAKLASSQRQTVIEYPARRGAIFDREGEPLAISVDLQSICVDPSLVKDAREQAAKLAPILDMEPVEIEGRLLGAVPGDRFEYIARQVDPKVAKKIEKLGPPDLIAATSKTFRTLGRQNLFALAFRTNNMKTPAGRARKIASLVAMLARGQTVVPERARPSKVR